MKKSLKLIASIVVIIAFALTSMGIGTIQVTAIKLSTTSIKMQVGKTYTLKVSFTPNNATNKKLTFSSSNKKVATVDKSGKIKGIIPGKTTVTATSVSNKKAVAKCNVIIEAKKGLTQISVFCREIPSTELSLSDGLPIWKVIEQKTNVKIKWNTVPGPQITQVMKTRMSSGQAMEDIVDVGYNDISDYIKAKIIIPLNELIEINAPNLVKFYKEYPIAKVWNSSPEDGKQYAISESTRDLAKDSAYGIVVRKDWLDKLSLKKPENVDDFLMMLKKFLEADPNGNGKQDETGFISNSEDTASFVIGSAFGLHGIYNNFIWAENEKVYLEYTTEKYKQFLQYMNRLYKEKLLDSEYFTQNNDILKKRVAGNVAGTFAYPYLAAAVTYDADAKSADANAVLDGLKPLKSQYGGQIIEMPPTEWKRWVVTKYAKNPDIVVSFLDYIFAGKEGYLLRNYGIEGETYNMMDGDPVFKDIITKASDQYQTKLKYGIQVDSLPILYAGKTQGEFKNLDQTLVKAFKDTSGYYVSSYFVGKVMKTREWTEKLTKQADLNTYVSESRVKFITGELSFSEWDKYLSNMNKLGLVDMLSVYQQIYDKYYSK